MEAPEVAPIRPGEALDWAKLEDYLRANIPELSGGLEAMQFPNGSANLTYLLRFGDTELVLRRPPFGIIAPGAHDMKREFKVLSKLWKVFDRAPRAYVFCDDHEVIGADFVVMERRRGEVVRDEVPASMAGLPDVGRRMAFALVDAMAEMHLLDPVEADVATLGRPEGFAERQVTGWQTRWKLVRPDDGPAQMDELPERLLAGVPAPTRVSIVHNDLKLDNCQFSPGFPDRVQSIFDWDMTTLGEPLVDLGTLLNYWPDPADSPDERRVSHQGLLEMGLPSRGEIIDHYTERTGIDTSSAGWYEAFAQWKTGVVIQQLHQRWVRGESTDPRMEIIADRLPVLAASASALLDRLG
ncbi:MAG: aminoglycoside phosphotransferase [Ilumatobacteraceae bacterium]|nr:aminoglycoside phosphotransferase [Ilumatobacteraceae bacterium]